VIHDGDRATDQLVIMSSAMCAALMARAQTTATRPSPYAGFTQALADGRLEVPADANAVCQTRRHLRDLRDDSGLTIADMVAAGADARAPRRRRPAGT